MRQRLMMMLLAALPLVGCNSAALDNGIRTVFVAKPLSAEKMQDLFKDGLELNLRYADEHSGNFFYKSDGTVQANIADTRYDGTWRLADNELCETWKEGIEHCYTLFPTYFTDSRFLRYDSFGTFNARAKQL